MANESDTIASRAAAAKKQVSGAITAQGIAWILALAGLGLIFYYRSWISLSQIAAMAIGCLVGCVEILSRYRHAPARALMTGSGLGYILVNVGASWAAYYMLGVFEVFDSTKPAEELKLVLTAGFGSLVFMRSSLFKARIGDTDIGIGPAAVLDSLLLVADRGVDRREAVARARDVTALVSHVQSPLLVAQMLTQYCLSLMQNVDDETVKGTTKAVAEVMADTTVPDSIKIDIVALRLGLVVGPYVLAAAVEALGERLNVKAVATGPAPLNQPAQPVAPPAAQAVEAQALGQDSAGAKPEPRLSPEAVESLQAEILEKAGR